MKLFTLEGDELMDVSALRREGNELVIVGTIMGSMPTRAVLRPSQVRMMFALLSISMVPFLCSMLFRSDNVRAAKHSNPLAGLLDDY